MVRAARVSDADRIGVIHVDGWRAAYKEILPESFLAGLSAEKRAAGWKFAIERDPRSVFVFESERAVAGWAALGKERSGIEGAGEIFALYVDPQLWGRGYGRELMQAAEAELWSRGYASCVLWVLERNSPARAFYRRVGYEDDGGRKSEQIGQVELIEHRMRKERSTPDQSWKEK